MWYMVLVREEIIAFTDNRFQIVLGSLSLHIIASNNRIHLVHFLAKTFCERLRLRIIWTNIRETCKKQLFRGFHRKKLCILSSISLFSYAIVKREQVLMTSRSSISHKM